MGPTRIPLQISLQGALNSEALVARILKQAAKLEAIHPRLTGCRVTISDLVTHEGGQFEVRIDARVPANESIVACTTHADVYAALRNAFDSLLRQLRERVGKATRRNTESNGS